MAQDVKTKTSKNRLLILDVDNTLLHVPVYDNLMYALSGRSPSEEEFYNTLPEGGLSFYDDSPLKVYPRPHLIEFLSSAEGLGYDLALCTTGTREYIEKVLPACGLSLDRFISVVTREQLENTGTRLVKDIRYFASLGYKEDQIVAIDDREDVYRGFQRSKVLKISAFDVKHDSFSEDNELLLTIQRLYNLGDRSLSAIREAQDIEWNREKRLMELAYAAFDSNKYRKLPFIPDIFLRAIDDLEKFPGCKELVELSLSRFLIYKEYGLVGAIERKEDHFMINNFCPDVWTEVSAGVSRIGQDEEHLSGWFWHTASYSMSEMCKAMGYQVDVDDLFTLAAVTLEPSNFGGFHVLALSEGMRTKDPMSYG